MNASEFTDAQKAFIIKQGDNGTAVAEISRKAGISPATCFNWTKRYAGLLPTEVKRLRAPLLAIGRGIGTLLQAYCRALELACMAPLAGPAKRKGQPRRPTFRAVIRIGSSLCPSYLPLGSARRSKIFEPG